MKIIDLIESRDKVFNFMYHGTTDKFLKSILKNGLLPIGTSTGFKYVKKPTSKEEPETPSDIDTTAKKIPQAEKIPKTLGRSFGSQQQAFLSFEGGTYITTDIQVAKEAAKAASSIHGGNPILIEISHLITSGIMDEDHVFYRYVTEIINLYKNYARGLEYYDYEKVNSINENFISDPNVINNFLNYAKKSITWGSRMTKKSELIVKEFFVKVAIEVIKLFERRVSGYTPDTCTFTCRDEYSLLIMEKTEIRNLMKNFIDTLKIFEPDGPVRINRPIKFKGNTRIIKITDIEEKKIFYVDQNYLRSIQKIVNSTQTYNPKKLQSSKKTTTPP